MYEETVSGNGMHEERCRNSRWAEDKEGKRQNALKKVVDLKPSLVNEDKYLPLAGRKPWKGDTLLKREESPTIPWVFANVLSSLSNKTAIKSFEYQ